MESRSTFLRGFEAKSRVVFRIRCLRHNSQRERRRGAKSSLHSRLRLQRCLHTEACFEFSQEISPCFPSIPYPTSIAHMFISLSFHGPCPIFTVLSNCVTQNTCNDDPCSRSTCLIRALIQIFLRPCILYTHVYRHGFSKISYRPLYGLCEFFLCNLSFVCAFFFSLTLVIVPISGKL